MMRKDVSLASVMILFAATACDMAPAEKPEADVDAEMDAMAECAALEPEDATGCEAMASCEAASCAAMEEGFAGGNEGDSGTDGYEAAE